MRILHVITQKPFATGSGVYLTGIVKAMGREHEQYIICGLNRGDEAVMPLTDHQLTLDPVVFDSSQLPFPVPGMSDVMPYKSSLYSAIRDEDAQAMLDVFLDRIESAVGSFRPDLILFEHLYLLTAAAAMRIRTMGGEASKIPLLGICHGSELRQLVNTDRWRAQIGQGIGQLDRLIATHDEQAAVIRDLYGVPAEQIRVLGSGFDHSIFHLQGNQQEQPDPPDPLQLVYTGKLARAKGVPELLRACDIVAASRRIHLTLIGAGADPLEAAEIEEAALSKPYPVVLTGLLHQKEIARIYRKSHILILPSFYEGMPLVVPEALACGMSVAVTDLPGFDEWLRPFASRVRRIPRPQMESADEPTKTGREQFIPEIARAILFLADHLGQSPMPDLSSLTWQGLAGRILGSAEM